MISVGPCVWSMLLSPRVWPRDAPAPGAFSMAPRSLFTLISLVAVLLVAGCGRGGGVPEDSVAVVDGDSITQQQYDALIAQAKKTFKQDKREFPKAGTAERKQLDQQAISYLVQRVQLAQAAADRDIEVTDA